MLPLIEQAKEQDEAGGQGDDDADTPAVSGHAPPAGARSGAQGRNQQARGASGSGGGEQQATPQQQRRWRGAGSDVGVGTGGLNVTGALAVVEALTGQQATPSLQQDAQPHHKAGGGTGSKKKAAGSGARGSGGRRAELGNKRQRTKGGRADEDAPLASAALGQAGSSGAAAAGAAKRQRQRQQNVDEGVGASDEHDVAGARVSGAAAAAPLAGALQLAGVAVSGDLEPLLMHLLQESRTLQQTLTQMVYDRMQADGLHGGASGLQAGASPMAAASQQALPPGGGGGLSAELEGAIKPLVAREVASNLRALLHDAVAAVLQSTSGRVALASVLAGAVSDFMHSPAGRALVAGALSSPEGRSGLVDALILPGDDDTTPLSQLLRTHEFEQSIGELVGQILVTAFAHNRT